MQELELVFGQTDTRADAHTEGQTNVRVEIVIYVDVKSCPIIVIIEILHQDVMKKQTFEKYETICAKFRAQN